MKLPRKPILVLDFDGVIHGYQSGWKGVEVVPDPPVPGAIEALLGYLEHFTVCIVSSRFNYWKDSAEIPNVGPHSAVTRWLIKHGVPMGQVNPMADLGELDPGRINLCAAKPAALLTIDDRAWTFAGRFPTAEEIRAFRPWKGKSV